MVRSVRDYDSIANTLGADGSRDERMVTVADALWDALHGKGVSWCGFYIDQPDEPDDRRLILGPHRDKPACSPIGLHGACGQALIARATLIVRDVAELGEGYIACDPKDRSEIVIPLFHDEGTCWGVLDIDSRDIAAFDEDDEAGLKRVLAAAGLVVDDREDE